MTCIDENMFRFSSAVRAFDTWTGFGISNAQPSVSSKAAVLAYEVLSDEGKINTYLDSEDNIKAYLALWGCGCREMKEKRELIRIVRTPEGEAVLDPTGKKSGRGAYVCRRAECLQRAIRQKQLERQLEITLTPEITEALTAEMERLNADGSDPE